ncbi:MAG: DUF2058 domain-containing protein [Pseudomonadota bacterium]|nr:DUF2058 domain-containing protein [Pseudomonadota bacterium]
MAGSLFDQLKKSGLVNEQQAKKAKREKYQQTKKSKGKKGGQAVNNEAAELAAKAAQEKAEKDRQLNLERKQQQEKRALQAEVLQIIKTNQVTNFKGDIAYNFADGEAVKTLYVNRKTQKSLIAETLRIARFNGGYALISIEAAEKVEQRDKDVLIPLVGEDDSISKEDQDYYAQFEIPDDLVW